MSHCDFHCLFSDYYSLNAFLIGYIRENATAPSGINKHSLKVIEVKLYSLLYSETHDKRLSGDIAILSASGTQRTSIRKVINHLGNKNDSINAKIRTLPVETLLPSRRPDIMNFLLNDLKMENSHGPKLNNSKIKYSIFFNIFVNLGAVLSRLK